MNPEQRVFTEIRRICKSLYGEAVYDYNPPESTPYPFVHIGEFLSQNKRLHKENLNGDAQITLHFWHDNVRQRGTLTKMMSDVENAVIIELGVEAEDVNIKVLEDRSTAITLMHGIMEFNIKRYKN